MLPRVHGSALFERGETQILGVTTLNMLRMEQMVDTLNPENRKRYMHHYNFPPYSTGETGRVRLARSAARSATARSPSARCCRCCRAARTFPYAIRQVSEALGSNGSTSMGSVCASTMSLLNAGVPLKAPVAGIAMGLVFEGGEYATLTDILGAEDAFGDMDFKVAGTQEFVTALQLDTKLDGIPSSRARRRAAAGPHAPASRSSRSWTRRSTSPTRWRRPRRACSSVKIPVDKIGEVIGPKGKMINQIQADTGADITVEDDGTIYIGATDGPSAEAALATINQIANPTMPKVGERFLGTVVKTAAFGAFVSLLPGKDGLVHISKLGNGKRIGKVEDVVNVGDKLQVEITEIDQRGKISLTPVPNDAPRRPRRSPRRVATALGHRTRALPARERSAHRSTVRRTVLPGGLRVVTEQVPGVRSVGVRHLGRRRQRATSARRSHGASHFLEHLLFKGTKRRDALEIAAVMDAVGGEMNAFTAKEYTCYYARVLDEDLPLAVDVVSDMVLSSVVTSDDVEVERGRDPRGDRHARRRAGRRRPRRVRRRAVRRLAARPAGHRHGRDHRGAVARGHRRLLPAALRPAAHGRRGRRRRSTTTCCVGLVEQAFAEPPVRRRRARAAAARPAARRRSRRRVVVAGARRPSRPTSCSARPALRARRPAALRAVGAVRRARRRHVEPAVPEVREERGLAYSVYSYTDSPRRHRPVRRLRRLRAEQGRRGARPRARRARRGRRARRHRRGGAPRARAACAARWCSASRTPARG